MANLETISILDGNTFVVSDRSGDILAHLSEPQGLFNWDTRYLSRWQLTINGQPMQVLSTDDLHYFAAQFFLVPGTTSVYLDADISVMRRRAVGNGFLEEINVHNHRARNIDLTVHIAAGADFADLFDVKDATMKKGEPYTRIERDALVLGYRRETFVRETWITPSQPATLSNDGLDFVVQIGPNGSWSTKIDVATSRMGGVRPQTKYRDISMQARPALEKGLAEMLESSPQVHCDWRPLETIYRQSLVDLAALRFYPQMLPGRALPAAGLPWFMTIFGRDSIITSLQALPFAPELAETTLLDLELLQGTHVDDFRDQEPGKIMHELRFGEMTAFEEQPHSPYYGSADSTPLFLILLDEYERWTGNEALVRQFEPAARAALSWIDTYGDRNKDGYVEYQRRNTTTGLENQCWKDSWNSILFADGSLSKLPRSTCEIQGYVYDAKRRCARLAREFWHDGDLANRLEREARDLKVRFNRDFWLPERECFALALDGDGRKVDAITSNIGHLLWSDIVAEDKIPAIVNHLMSDALFSGWGVRTMATTEGGYNPLGYHIGTVWPHDNTIIALGLTKQGYRKEAARIALGILDAAPYFRHRLPETFAGYPRTETSFPVEYPTACSPQAWATGAPLLLLRALLGLEPIGERLLVDPALPQLLGQLEVLNIPGRWGHADAFGRGRFAMPRFDTWHMETQLDWRNELSTAATPIGAVGEG